jgi:DNA repair exonuclease SbcCD nuclease subunit
VTKLLAFGDLHLRVDRLDDQRRVLDQVAVLAIEEGVAGILCAGDVLDGPTIVPEQIDVFARFIARLQGRIPVVAVSGNGKHDLATRGVNGVEIFNHLDGITVCSRPDVVEVAGVAVACLPWTHPGRLIASMGAEASRDEVNAIAADLLVDVARDLHERCAQEHRGLPSILLAHWSVTGAVTPTGREVGPDFGPILNWHALDALGFDAMVFGHIHAVQSWLGDGSTLRTTFVADDHRPATTSTHFYVGSTVALDFSETGPHGCWLLDLDEHRSTFVPLDSPRFVTVGLDVDDEHGASLDSDEDVTGAFVRVVGSVTRDQMRTLDFRTIRDSLTAAGARRVDNRIEIVREQRARVDGVDEQLDIAAALELYLAANEIPDELAGRMRDRTRDYIQAAA